ncbi:hypothetical protein KCP71_03375 [Salmonella enterica subsp. enterica]|nr:hypothetical protein KCP71_03375 [Salmonella enterica subsp. enterica]
MQRYDRKIVILMKVLLIWSIATVFVGFTSSVYVIFDLSAGAGIYRRHLLAAASPASPTTGFQTRTDAGERHYQYYGRFTALGTGFICFVSAGCFAFGWRNVLLSLV